MLKRILPLVSVAVAVFLIAATPAAAQTPDPTPNLQRLVNELGVQIDLRYRANLPEYQSRYDQLSQAVAAWNASAKSDADRAAIATWLGDAIRSAMPGSAVVWPSLPQFDQPTSAPAAAAEPTPAVAAEPAPAPVGVVTNKPVVPSEPSLVKQQPAEPQEPAAEKPEQSKPQATQPSTEGSSKAAEPAAEKPERPKAQAAQPSTEGSPKAAEPAAGEPAAVPLAPAKDAAGQPAATPSSAPAVDKTGTADQAGTKPSGNTEFWLDHPAAGDLPPDMKLDNPFKDDALPAVTPLPAEPPTSDLPSLFDSP
jgi:hypothetical protein